MSQAPVQCFYPDRITVATGHTPCNASAEQSWCCDEKDYCLTNGYCFQAFDDYANRIARGSCTDQSWRDPTCPFNCADVNTSMDTILYLAYNSAPGRFCCDKPYNYSTHACPLETQGTHDEFNLSASEIVYNRGTGASMQSGSLELPTVTMTAAAAGDKTAIAAGIAVPLAVLLVVSWVVIGVLVGRLRRARSEFRAAEGGESKSRLGGDGFGQGYKARDWPYEQCGVVNEVAGDGRPVEIGTEGIVVSELDEQSRGSRDVRP